MSASKLRPAAVLASALAACMSAAACTATETGNPVGEQRLALTARSSVGDVSVGPAADDAIEVREAWVVLGDLRFERSTDCDSGDDQDADIEGPIIADLIADRSVLAFDVADGSYCRIRVPLERAEDDSGVPDDLVDHAILIRGVTALGTPFAIRSDDTREADIRAQGEPFSLQRAGESLILAFDVGRWLEGLELDDAEVQDDGVIWVDHDRERSRLDRFEENVESALELFRDDDGDEELDAAEADAPLASGG